MRTGCADCTRKHLAQAVVLIEESYLGYPEHGWLAAGHLAEASEEIMEFSLPLAEQIRRYRLDLMDTLRDNSKFSVSCLLEMIGIVTAAQFGATASPDSDVKKVRMPEPIPVPVDSLTKPPVVDSNTRLIAAANSVREILNINLRPGAAFTLTQGQIDLCHDAIDLLESQLEENNNATEPKELG